MSTAHHERRIMPYRAQQMFDLVNDVAQYPDFLPWVSAARVRSDVTTAQSRLLDADLVVSFKVFRECFRSQVRSDLQELHIDVTYLDGPFRTLNNHWRFYPRDSGCEVEFYVDFEFRSRLLQATIGLIFHEAMQRIVAAFEARADALYGPKGAGRS